MLTKATTANLMCLIVHSFSSRIPVCGNGRRAGRVPIAESSVGDAMPDGDGVRTNPDADGPGHGVS
jgi:hypothetical protein